MAGTTALTKAVDSVRSLLSGEQMQRELKAALPKHLTPERLIRVALTAITKNPKLLECTQSSLALAVLESAQLGLVTDGVLGHGHLIPYGPRAQFQIGYRGAGELAMRSEKLLKPPRMGVIREGDTWERIEEPPSLKHTPAREDNSQNPILAAYATVVFKNGSTDHAFMWLSEIEQIRDRTQAYKAFTAGRIKETPWIDHFPEMAKKTALLRLAKILPLSPELQRAAAKSELLDDGNYVDEAGLKQVDIVDVTEATEPKASATARLKDKFGLKAGTEIKAEAEVKQEQPDAQEAPKSDEARPDVKSMWQKAVAMFSDEYGVAENRLLIFVGLDTPEQVLNNDLEKLRASYKAIKSGETTVEAEFPPLD